MGVWSIGSPPIAVPVGRVIVADQRIIMAFDGSSAAQSLLRRVVRTVRNTGDLYDGVVVATVGVEPAALDAALDDARALAGPDVAIEVRHLNPGDPIGSLHVLIDALPDATLAAPVGARGRAPWYGEATRFGGMDHKIMLFFLRPHELREARTSRRETAAARLMRVLIRAVRRLLDLDDRRTEAERRDQSAYPSPSSFTSGFARPTARAAGGREHERKGS